METKVANVGTYTGLSYDDLIDRLEFFIGKYLPIDLSDLSPTDTFSHIYNLFNDCSQEEIEIKIHIALIDVICLQHSFVIEGYLIDGEDEDTKNILVKFNKLFEMFYCAKFSLRAVINIHQKCNPMYDSEVNINLGLSRFEPLDCDKLKPYQSLLRYLLFSLNEDQYRRHIDQCMKRVIKEGYDTHSWVPVMSIEDYVYHKCQYGVNQHQWKNLTDSPNNGKNATTYLMTSRDTMYFPDIIKDRKLFTFNNGIYETAIFDKEEGLYVDRWYPFSKDRENNAYISEDVSPHRTSVNYFDQEFHYDDVENEDISWYSIKTPNFQSILDYQEFSEEVCKWMYILCGRILHEVNELDEWQVIPFLLGKAQTGKSTICTRIIKAFYDLGDVGVMSNNIEKQFGLGALQKKLAFIGPEINHNFKLDQTEFQSLISGEDIQVATKNKTAKSVRWNVPGMLAGNNPPGYQDNQGSISRRLLIFKFDKKVKKGDTRLGKKLELEIPNIILKSNKAYLETVNKYPGIDIWNLVPEYFIKTRDEMAEYTNALIHMLKNGKTILDPKVYCKLEKFKARFKDYCIENSFKSAPWRPSYYGIVFEEFGITIRKDKLLDKYDNQVKDSMWVIGVEFNDTETVKINEN